MKKKILPFLVSLTILISCNDKPEVEPTNYDVLTVYPNPVAQVAYVEVRGDVNQPFTLSVFDIKGKLLLEEKGISGSQYFSVNLSNEPKGEYQVILQAQNIRATQKILKL